MIIIIITNSYQFKQFYAITAENILKLSKSIDKKSLGTKILGSSTNLKYEKKKGIHMHEYYVPDFLSELKPFPFGIT